VEVLIKLTECGLILQQQKHTAITAKELATGSVYNGKAKGQCPQHRKVNEHEQHRKHRISDWGIVPFERRVRHGDSDG